MSEVTGWRLLPSGLSNIIMVATLTIYSMVSIIFWLWFDGSQFEPFMSLIVLVILLLFIPFSAREMRGNKEEVDLKFVVPVVIATAIVSILLFNSIVKTDGPIGSIALTVFSLLMSIVAFLSVLPETSG